MRMNPLIALGIDYADPMRAIATGALARERVDANQTRNALAAAYAQHGAGAMRGDTNALAGIAALDPAVAQGLYTGVQDNRRADAGLDLRRQDTQSAIAARQAGVAQDAARTRNDTARLKLLEQETAAAMAKASREEKMAAISTIGQFLPEFEAAPDASAWDRIAQMSGQEDLVGQFGQRDVALAMGRGALRGAQRPDPIKGRPGDVFLDPNTMQPIGGVPETPEPGFRDATPEEARRYNATAGQFGPDNKFYPLNPPSGMTVFDRDGNPIVQTGAGPKPLTEGQSKDNMYLTSAQGALPDVDKYETALAGLSAAANAVAGAVPGGGFAQSEEYQMAQNAAMEFGAAILRKESGAALTKEDITWLTARYIPVAGDKPGTIARKREARRRAVAGIKSGMSKAQMDAVESAIGSAKEPIVIDGYTIEAID